MIAVATDHWQAAAEALRPPPELTVSEWADRHRVLTAAGGAAEPGPWRTSRTPYLREIMDCLSATSPVERVVFMKSTQVGATEAGNNWIGYVIQHAPGPMICVQPSHYMMKRFTKQRLSPLIESTPELRNRVGSRKARDAGNTLEIKEFPGGILVLATAGSASQLASMPARYLFFDEADKAGRDVDGQGDPLDQAEDRTETFGHRRRVLIASTPAMPKGLSRIEAEYLASDRRRFWVPCRRCGELQVLIWEQVQWPPGRPDRAAYICSSCNAAWSEADRSWSIGRGEWRPEAEFKGTAGFHLWSAYSPWTTLAKLAAAYERVKPYPDKRKHFTQNRLAETYEEKGDDIDPTGLRARCEAYDASPLPEGVCVITAAADIQGDRIEVEIVGWGVGEENWSLDYVVLPGDPTTSPVWESLDEQLLRTFQHPWGEELRIQAACVDSGGHHTQAVYKFCRERYARRVWAIKGFDGEGRPIMERPGLKKPFVKVGVDSAKSRVYSRLNIADPGPGYCHFPVRYEAAYFDGLTAEKLITVYRRGFPRRVWVKKQEGQPNEPLDLRAYNIAALVGLNPDLKVSAQQLAVRAGARQASVPTGPESDDEPHPWPPPRGGRSRWANNW